MFALLMDIAYTYLAEWSTGYKNVIIINNIIYITDIVWDYVSWLHLYFFAAEKQ